MSALNIEGMALADGVVETIVALAVKDTEGVASLGASNSQGILSTIAGKKSLQGVEVTPNEDDSLSVSVHIEVQYGSVLPEVAAQVRQSVADAVLTQVGLKVASVDVYIDGIRFE